MSSNTRIAPIVIAASATLKAQKWDVPQYTSTKSTTWPTTARSMRLPNAPPRISDSPNRASRSWNPSCVAVGGDRDEGDRGNADHDERLVWKVRRVQQAECRAGVLHVRKVQEAGDEVDGVVQRQHVPDDCLGQLIHANDREDRDDLDRPRVRARRGDRGGLLRRRHGVLGNVVHAPVIRQPGQQGPRWPPRIDRTALRSQGPSTGFNGAPAAGAFVSFGARTVTLEAVASGPLFELDLRHDEQHRQVVAATERAARPSRLTPAG